MSQSLSGAELEALVLRYFAGVDAEDFDEVRATLTDDCLFTVETHNVRLEGIAAIEGMLRRLWDNHAAVEHKDFVFTTMPETGQVAVRFQVVNTHPDGAKAYKSNANFFETRDGQFSRVSVYMAGENTLDGG